MASNLFCVVMNVLVNVGRKMGVLVMGKTDRRVVIVVGRTILSQFPLSIGGIYRGMTVI